MSVLKFVRGMDLSDTDFGDKFPTTIDQLKSMRWLRLNRTGLEGIPSAVNRLSNLEHLYVDGNKLLLIPPSIKLLTGLHALRASYNDLTQNEICGDLFRLEELTTVDLSHNSMTELPADISLAGNLVILSLGHNQLAGLSTDFLRYCTDLEHLDVGYNKIEVVLPQMRRLEHLRTLILSGNPLGGSTMRSLSSLVELERLELKATSRTVSNLPPNMEELVNLTDLDLSENEITEIPPALTGLLALRRLNLSDNKISAVPVAVAKWTCLESLNLSRNQLTVISTDLCALTTLRRLFVNNNLLAESALPSAIQGLSSLETLQASNNALTDIPVELFRCKKITQLMLHNNKLKTLPEEVHSLPNLKDLKVNGNAGFVMPLRPPPPVDEVKELYNIDFDAAVNFQRTMSSERVSLPRKPSLIGLHKNVSNVSSRAGKSDDQAKVLKGLQVLAESGSGSGGRPDAPDLPSDTIENLLSAPAATPKKWAESLHRPNLDYSDLFAESYKTKLGLSVWRIENFLPVTVQSIEHGRFYEADCYIILENRLDSDDNHVMAIHFWIGRESSLDKKASAAIHAVNLRNFLGATSSTLREEQEDESREFMKLFNNNISYVQGGTESGFFEVEEVVRPTRLYVLHGSLSLRCDAVELDAKTMSSDHLYMLDAHSVIFLWRGKNVRSVAMQKGRLFLAKTIKAYSSQHKHISSEEVLEGEESPAFLAALGVQSMPARLPTKFEPPSHPAKLHLMRLGDGYIELPQVLLLLSFEQDIISGIIEHKCIM
jgi:Leucine-rich repeat (LRR) protein